MTKRGPKRDADHTSAWPAASVEIRPLNSIRLNPENPRRHSLDQIEQIQRSLRKFRWVFPVLIDETGMLIAGHGRVRAAIMMGWESAPVIVARGWSEDEKRAYMIADNEIAAKSDWDPKMIRADIKKLQASNFDISLVGFTEEELLKMTLDPKDKLIGDPKEITMIECPTCGRVKRKVEE